MPAILPVSAMHVPKLSYRANRKTTTTISTARSIKRKGRTKTLAIRWKLKRAYRNAMLACTAQTANRGLQSAKNIYSLTSEFYAVC